MCVLLSTILSNMLACLLAAGEVGRSRSPTGFTSCLACLGVYRSEQEMERVAQETMDKAMTYQNELEQQKAAGQKQVRCDHCNRNRRRTR